MAKKSFKERLNEQTIQKLETRVTELKQENNNLDSWRVSLLLLCAILSIMFLVGLTMPDKYAVDIADSICQERYDTNLNIILVDKSLFSKDIEEIRCEPKEEEPNYGKLKVVLSDEVD